MWVISAADASMGIDLTGIDKLVYYKTDPEGKTVVDQNGQPILDHYELVGHGFGNLGIAVSGKVNNSELIVNDIKVDSSCLSGTSTDTRQLLTACNQVQKRRFSNI